MKGEGSIQRTYEGPMDMDNSMVIDYGSGGQVGWRGAKGGSWDNYNSINSKYLKIKIKKQIFKRYVMAQLNSS